MTKRFLTLAALFALLLTTVAADDAYEEFRDVTPDPAFHLRVVRVSGAGIAPGAALGTGPDGHQLPVIDPGQEVWGTPAQLDAVARALDAERADPVTGFFVFASEEGTTEFVRQVYVGDSILTLRFLAWPAPFGDAPRELELELRGPDAAEPPLAEARLRVRTNRTVAIASPTPYADDWLVLALTAVDQAQVAATVRREGEIRLGGVEPVTMPKLVDKVAVNYPETARREKLEGEVVLQAIIDEQGRVLAPVVLRMTPGTEEMAASAVDAVRQWRYEPATLEGEPVAVWFTIFVQFRLS